MKTMSFLKKVRIVLLLIVLTIVPGRGFAQCWLSQLAKDINNGTAEFKAYVKGDESAFDTYRTLVNAQGVASLLRTDAVVLNGIAEFKKDAKLMASIGGERGLNEFLRTATREEILAKVLAEGADEITSFVSKPLAQKLDDITNSWKAVYPEIFVERRFFEDVMGHYRYAKSSGWGHTADIADNFKAIDFYDEFTEVGSDIFAKTAVSMKTTTTKSIDSWLGTNAVTKNIDNLKQAVGAGTGKGITWNGKTIFYSKAEIHIYMPKENITPALKTEWLERLAKDHPTIKFEINSLEDFVK